MNHEIKTYNCNLSNPEMELCNLLATTIDEYLPEAESKLWHRHPTWFLEGNPVVGYSKIKAGIRLMFWSGASFEEDKLKLGTGKFKDASILYNSLDEVIQEDVIRWIEKSKIIQWDYKNLVKRKGKLLRLV